MPNSLQLVNEHDTMIKPQGVLLTKLSFHSAGHYNECVAAHNSVPPDPTMTVDNVTQVIDKIEADKWEVLGFIDFQLGEIQRRHSTDTEKTHACADYYVNCHPNPSWEDFVLKLYVQKEFTAARESKSFMSTGKY